MNSTIVDTAHTHRQVARPQAINTTVPNYNTNSIAVAPVFSQTPGATAYYSPRVVKPQSPVGVTPLWYPATNYVQSPSFVSSAPTTQVLGAVAVPPLILRSEDSLQGKSFHKGYSPTAVVPPLVIRTEDDRPRQGSSFSSFQPEPVPPIVIRSGQPRDEEVPVPQSMPPPVASPPPPPNPADELVRAKFNQEMPVCGCGRRFYLVKASMGYGGSCLCDACGKEKAGNELVLVCSQNCSYVPGGWISCHECYMLGGSVVQCICRRPMSRLSVDLAARSYNPLQTDLRCNICRRYFATGGIWHCKSMQCGPHPSGYDICDDCALRQPVYGDQSQDNLQRQQSEAPAPPKEEEKRSRNRCC
eukprot:GHVL01003424.1.p1 GENE.GHVL01003424.1~~GHVL01003424.1.p1  ORF type:complete len:358 (+),score=43.06 GHVL01003424.1:85-1158(+)